jgi:hypothetical protein
MRNYRVGAGRAPIAAAALLAALATIPAHAQGVPGGSYLESCTNVHLFADRIVADCRRVDGGWDRTALRDVGRCVGGISNMNGRLICTYGEPGYGSAREYRPHRWSNEYYGYGR